MKIPDRRYYMPIKLESRIIEVIVWLGFMLMAAIIMYRVPPDNDDFNQYFALACWQHPHMPKQYCAGLTLKLFGVINWPRAYPHVGVAYSFLYYPLFLLWPQWPSTVLLNVLLMIPGLLTAS